MVNTRLAQSDLDAPVTNEPIEPVLEEQIETTAEPTLFDTTSEPIDSSLFETTTTELDTGALGAFLALYFGFLCLIGVISIVAMWKIFTKAGRAGWKSIVPIYNQIVLLQIAGKPAWWILLLFIPFVNIVVLIIFSIELAKAFGKSEVFGILGLFFFSLIGYLILAFDNSTYRGQSPTPPMPDNTPPAPTPTSPSAPTPTPPVVQ
jgi:hypothetical protein